MPKGPENSPKFKIHQNYWQGGATVSQKLGIANSFYYSQSLDFRTDPAQISVLPGPSAISQTAIVDLIQAFEQDLAGVRYGIGDAGNLYKFDASNTVTKIGTLNSNGSAGLLYNQVSDSLYIPGQQTVSYYGPLNNSNQAANLKKDNFAQSASNVPGCTTLYDSTTGFYQGALRTTAASTYSVPTSISENSVDFCFFAPDIEPFYSIKVKITSKGTGDWTLTLHDSLNNKLEAVTVANASLNNGVYNEFVFTTPGGIRAFVNASQTGTSPTYHFHLTSTVSDGTATVVTSGDLSTSDFLLYAYRLVKTNNGWHPTGLFTGSGKPLLCIGNGPYLSTYDFSNDSAPTNQQWQRHNLTFKSGYEVCGLSTNGQYLVIACERRSTSANRKFQSGILYFWDGSTNAPNFSIDIPMGAPYGLYTFNNVTYFACAGSLFAWSGGQTVIKVRKLAYQNTDYLGAVDNTIINPNMMTSRYNLLMMGYPSTTTNVNINYGVWSWGTVELTFPNSYCLSYTLSNGQLNYSAANNLKIGAVTNFVDDMYTSWQYTDSNSVTHYGVDLLNNSSAPAASFDWQSLIYDGGVVYKWKQALRMKCTFEAIPTNTQLRLKYKIDRGVWNYGPYTSVGDTSAVLEINNGRFHELQWGFEGTCTSATSPPVVLGITVEIDPLGSEVDLIKDNQ